MEKEKNNKGLLAILIIIIVILTALCILFATETISLKSNKDNITEETTTKNNAGDVTSEDLITKLVGTYSYKGKYVDNEKEIGENFDIKDTIYDEVILSSTGEAEAKSGSVRAGGYTAKGKWYISKEEIIILNEECTPESIDDPRWIYKYKIENDTITLSSINNTMESMTLEKIK